jgi:hypothetical protein
MLVELPWREGRFERKLTMIDGDGRIDDENAKVPEGAININTAAFTATEICTCKKNV